MKAEEPEPSEATAEDVKPKATEEATSEEKAENHVEMKQEITDEEKENEETKDEEKSDNDKSDVEDEAKLDETPVLGVDDETSNQGQVSALPMTAKPNIRINITSQENNERQESVVSQPEEADIKPKDDPDLDLDPEAIVQEANEEILQRSRELKPKVYQEGREFTTMPQIRKEGDVSSLCSIM